MSIKTTTVITLFILFLALPRTAFAHAKDAPKELISQLIENYESGLYTISASQFASAEITELEVRPMVFGGILPEDLVVEVEAVSAETNQSFTTTMIRHHDAFTTTLPLNGENWAVTIEVISAEGEGSAETTVIPYRPPVEASQLVKNVTFTAPFLLMISAVIVLKRFDISLTS